MDYYFEHESLVGVKSTEFFYFILCIVKISYSVKIEFPAILSPQRMLFSNIDHKMKAEIVEMGLFLSYVWHRISTNMATMASAVAKVGLLMTPLTTRTYES